MFEFCRVLIVSRRHVPFSAMLETKIKTDERKTNRRSTCSPSSRSLRTIMSFGSRYTGFISHCTFVKFTDACMHTCVYMHANVHTIHVYIHTCLHACANTHLRASSSFKLGYILFVYTCAHPFNTSFIYSHTYLCARIHT